MKTKDYSFLLFVAILLYLLGAFVAADFNIQHWTGGCRFTIAMLFGFVTIFYVPFKILEDK